MGKNIFLSVFSYKIFLKHRQEELFRMRGSTVKGQLAQQTISKKSRNTKQVKIDIKNSKIIKGTKNNYLKNLLTIGGPCGK
jgi:hypothetical protein